MIQLDRDSIWLTQADGQSIPCSLEKLTLEIAGKGAAHLDRDVLRHAAAGVLHYFKEELGRNRITLDEFAAALAQVLGGLGLGVGVSGAELQEGPAPDVRLADLRELACAAGKLGELDFFPRLRSTLRAQIATGPERIEFHSLRSAVKLLLGRKHWTNSCRDLEDRIVRALREWWVQEMGDCRPLLLVS